MRARLALVVCVALAACCAIAVSATPQPSYATCPNQCSNNGLCEKGVCVCHAGFSGVDCSSACPSLCSGNGQCVGGKCICKPGFGGEDCATAAGCPRSPTDHPELECSGHGVCHRPSQTCVCRQGYVGKDCSIDDGSCGSAHCSNHGHCRSGQCQCDLGYSGEHCEVHSVCPGDCNGSGQCIGGTCHCYPGFSGADCKQRDAQTCPGKNGGCNGNGVCANGKCVCSVGFTGESCATLADPDAQPFCAGGNKCSGRGVCRHNQCFCTPGFFGARCEKAGCAHGCGPMGFCSMGVCRCQPGWGGPDCMTKSECPNACSGHGICEKGVCACEPYYAGADCSKITLPALACPKFNGKECGGVGFCFLGQCFCEPSFSGPDCGTVVQNCPSNCGGPTRGTCRFGTCFCEPGYEGPGCEQTKRCKDGCERHGICLKGECKCALGYGGDDCSLALPSPARQAAVERDLLNSVSAQAAATPPVPRAICGSLGRACSAHGLCVSGACVCEAGWGGQDCGLVMNGQQPTACGPQGCSGNGECAFGTCICQPGWSGRSCDKPTFLPCPNDCSSHGLCYLGACECHPGFEGPDCSQVKSCEATGCVRGACVQGVCECVWGFKGANCSEAIAPSELPEKDYLSTEGLNTCGFEGCGAHGVCMAHQCVCVEGYTGPLCDLPILDYVPRPSSEPSPAHPLVSDVFGTQACAINCGLHGVCVGGSCACVDGWAGVACTISVPQVNAHHVYGSAADFLSIMTLQKRARIAPPRVSETAAVAVKATKVSLMESDSSASTEPAAPHLFRNTALLAAQKKEALQYSPDGRPTIGGDAKVVAAAPNQVQMSHGAMPASSTSYSMTMSPYLLTFLCFCTGVLVTIALKCLLDKRDQEKRKMKKMEELLQPAS